MTDVEVYREPQASNAWLDLMKPAADLATQIAGTEFVPEAYRRNPAAIAACILFGAELGIGPMQSLAKIDIVKGRPAPRAELARAKAFAAGHELWTEESTNTRVTVSGRRRGSQHVQTVTWTMDDAKKAGIAGNPNYSKYPRQMLLARASAELVRMMCPEVLGGIEVFAEEIGDADDVAPVADVKPAKSRKRSVDMAVNGEPPEQPIVDAEVVEQVGPTEAQTRKAMALFSEAGITDRAERLTVTSAYVGRDVASWNDLSKQDAGHVIDQLERLVAQQRPMDNADGEPALPGDTLNLDGAA